MKKISTLILSSAVFFTTYAGVSVSGPVVLGTVNQVHSTVHNHPNQLIINGQTQYSTNVTHLSDNKIVGTLLGYPNSQFHIATNNGQINGYVIVSLENDIAYKYTTNANSEVVLEQVSVNKVVCVDYAKNFIIENQQQNLKSQTAQNKVLSGPQGGPVPSYQSLAGSANVLYLDFDGYDLQAGSGWNNGDAMTADPAGYTDDQIRQAWSVTAEDYAPFNINVTTDESVFNNAAVGKRMRVVYTPTSAWKPGAGGVAYVGVFTNPDEAYYHPAWVFVDRMYTAQNSGECGSHESGHTLGLSHDGTLAHDTIAAASYYNGHGNWAPIMGGAYYKAITQFSSGEYTYADRTAQNDLTVISGYVAFKADDHADITANATTISFALNGTTGTVDSASNNGLVNNATDLDAFHFYTGGGTTVLNFIPSASIKTNLDIEVKLYNSSGSLVNTFNTGHNSNTIKGVTINQSLTADDYFVTIDGVGSGDATTGWSDYNSMGPYYITGTIPNAENLTSSAVATILNESIRIFPNPINNDGILHFSSAVDAVKVYDVTGKIIGSSKNTNQIDLSNQIAQGVYFVELSVNNQSVVTKVIR